MNQKKRRTTLRPLPFLIVEIADGAILKRGCEELKITGAGAVSAVRRIVDLASHGQWSKENLPDCFPKQARQAVERLLDELLARHFVIETDQRASLPAGSEDALDIFYWHFAEHKSEVAARLNERRVAILGVNRISAQISLALSASGMTTYEVIDHPRLRNTRMFDASGRLMATQWRNGDKHPKVWTGELDAPAPGCIIATSDFGDQEVMKEWNRTCLQLGVYFLPVVLLNLIGYIGPLVVPNETACFECMKARQNSHLQDPAARRAVEAAAFDSQAHVGFHPSMAHILGELAAFELLKLFSGAVPTWNVGTLMEVNLLATKMTARRVLKVPRCPACSPLNLHPSNIAEQTSFLSYKEDVQ